MKGETKLKNQYERMINKYYRQYLEERFKELNIGRAEAPYINLLHRKSPMKMNALISNVIFHKSHTTRAINQLLKDGLITKKKDEDDKRSYIIAITEKGMKVAEKVEEILLDWEELINQSLTSDERIQLENMRKKVYLNLKNYFEKEQNNETDV